MSETSEINPAELFLKKPPCSKTVCERTGWCSRRRYEEGETHNGATPQSELQRLNEMGLPISPDLAAKLESLPQSR